uniref:Uncharacterized protein n=1 Tax=Nymphaea colorata TaxID=210225 RepID=A0A5K0XM55_9MAGN
MSLRYVSRLYLNAGTRAVQSMKDQGSRLDTTGFMSIQPAGTKKGSQARRFSGGDSAKRASTEEKRRGREAEKAETVHHLICWGPR